MNIAQNNQGFGKNISFILTVLISILVIAAFIYALWGYLDNTVENQAINNDTNNNGKIIA